MSRLSMINNLLAIVAVASARNGLSTPSSPLSPAVAEAFVVSNSPKLKHTPPPSSSSSSRRHLFLDPAISGAVDIRNLYTQETIESSKSNEWGIPASGTLLPLGRDGGPPKEQLDNGGKVTLVGSGPGDPDLLTMKAYKLLQDPDALVIVDRLVSQEIKDLIKGDIKVARKLPGCAELAQEEIYWWTHQGLAAGKHVIRLKIGDPFVFGRGGEEVLMFRRFGVESKIIPVRSVSYYITFFFVCVYFRWVCCVSVAVHQYCCFLCDRSAFPFSNFNMVLVRCVFLSNQPSFCFVFLFSSHYS